MSPTFGTREVQGRRGTVQWKWSLLLQQTVFIQYCTSDWISTPLTQSTPAKLMISEKTAWVCFHSPLPLDCCIIQIYMPTCSRSTAHCRCRSVEFILAKYLWALAGADPWGQRGHVPPNQSNFSSLKRNICASRIKLQGEMLRTRQKQYGTKTASCQFCHGC